MHILFLTDNFPPEGNAPATRTFEHVKNWVDVGHKSYSNNLCAKFSRRKSVMKATEQMVVEGKKLKGINVWRVKTYITANEGFIKRTIDFLSFMLSSLLFGLFCPKGQCCNWYFSSVFYSYLGLDSGKIKTSSIRVRTT